MVVGPGGGDELKLLGVWDSPYVNRVQIVLNLKGLSYEYVEEDLMNKSDLLLGSNPVHKKVPVLIHNGKPIAESRVIVEYLDEAFAAGAGGSTGASVLPSDPYERAVARFWAAYVDDKLGSPWYTILFARERGEKVEAAARAISALETVEAGAFRDRSSEGKTTNAAAAPFFGGDSIGFVDVVLGSYLGWFRVIEKMIGVRIMDAARTPRLAAWAERFEAADAVRGVLPDDVDKVIDFLQAFVH
uniref:Glutathione S-transferase n=1 Tax=Oryza glumipatula TaxID=40148 RepID=A0A0E0BCZ6_9ORYZ